MIASPADGPSHVLVFNAGSSSLKLSVVAADGAVADSYDIDRWNGRADAPALRDYLERLAGAKDPPVRAIGHRVVHGGSRYISATLIDNEVRAGIAELTSLAPLHQPRARAGMDAATAAFPGLPQVACFDTAFHATMPPQAYTYALPATWRELFGLRKFGFHGLSHSYASRRAAELVSPIDRNKFRVVTCHLGAGSSLAAVQGGRSVDTTMGFTPVDGLVMATRCGSLDPGMLTWLASEGRIGVPELTTGLEHASGLAGLTGGSGDIREVSAAAQAGDPSAELALGVYAHRLVTLIAAMAAAMNGLDALAFTGGIGEHHATVRAAAAAGLGFLGVAVDRERNTAAHADADISADGAAVRTLVLTAREDAEVARSTFEVMRAVSS